MSQGPTPYTQTILLDANRLSSEEYSASNLANTDPSVFTNKVSSGITLDIGDQISIEGAHIAQRGAGGDTIEMKGRVLGQKEIIYTKFTNSSFVGYNVSATPLLYSPTGFAKQTASNITEVVDMKDNEANIVVEYFKTSNGENCFSLPRNFGNASGRNASVAGYNKAGGAHLTLNASYWTVKDGFPLGGQSFKRDPINYFGPDGGFNEEIGDIKVTTMLSISGAESFEVPKVKMDNSRFTLFKRETSVYSGSAVSAADLKSALNPRDGATADVATYPYVRFKQKLKLSVKPGYNTPSNIASEITNELQKTEDPQYLISPLSDFGSILQESAVNKGITCANYVSYNSSANKDYFDATLDNHMPVGIGGDAPLQTAESVAYSNNYDYVGFKRPDFVEKGRIAFPYNGYVLQESIDQVDALTTDIRTSIPWSDENLIKIKDFFDSQTLYPELLDGGVDAFVRSNYANYAGNGDFEGGLQSKDISASFREVSRFIHMDLSFPSQGAKNASQALGDDMYNISHTKASANASDISSSPVFIFYNKNSTNFTASETQLNTSFSKLAYGFGRRYNDGGATDMIAFTTEFIGGIPAARIVDDSGNFWLLNTKLGYDYHFNAYGNAAIGFCNGFSPLQYYGHQEYLAGKYIRNMYVGANDPLFNFNTVDSRFQFSNLHTAEKTGNFYNSGNPQPAKDTLAPPPSGQGSTDVFFINKQLRYDSWSPDMQPYSDINVSGSVSLSNVQSFIKPNERFQNSTIYDSHSGIVITDMGITEKAWNDSIWGLLGFRYNQFNPTVVRGAPVGDILNSNVRYTDFTTNVSGLTTNADITSVTAENYNMNVFSINMFKPSMLNSNLDYYNSTTTMGTVKTSASTVFPAISVQQTSTSIKATDLPRKIVNGYFLVNSDILDQANYYQTSNPLQTMAVVGKYNAATDFVNYDGGGPVFTVTKQKVITDIKTQIVDPAGERSLVGDNSGVIYKVIKEIKTDLKFAENTAAGMYGKPKK